jgi:hypothetical protein
MVRVNGETVAGTEAFGGAIIPQERKEDEFGE